MTAKIHDILEKQPHFAGGARCLHCKHDWQAIAPTASATLTCPSCDLNRGVFVGNVGAGIVLTCECGNQVWFVLPNSSIMCVYCGDNRLVPEPFIPTAA